MKIKKKWKGRKEKSGMKGKKQGRKEMRNRERRNSQNTRQDNTRVKQIWDLFGFIYLVLLVFHNLHFFPESFIYIFEQNNLFVY